MRRWLPWLAMVVIAGTAWMIAITGSAVPATEAERVRVIASEVRCPTCQGLSASESDAKAAQAIREEIRDRLAKGQTGDQIRGYLVSAYGDDILLRPRASGISGLVWALPVAALVAALAGLIAVFTRWRRQGELRQATDEDRRLVEEALRL
ncbi:MAG: cytochrome c-type biogenesis protein [Acidimicrobiales bacterium]